MSNAALSEPEIYSTIVDHVFSKKAYAYNSHRIG